jgi:hypothetical protein
VWEAWYDHDAPETRLFPDYNERLDQFEIDRFSFTMQRKSMW